jgi:hypothetical protein
LDRVISTTRGATKNAPVDDDRGVRQGDPRWLWAGRDAVRLPGTVGRPGIRWRTRIVGLASAVRLTSALRGAHIGRLAGIGGSVLGGHLLAVVVLGRLRHIGAAVRLGRRIVASGHARHIGTVSCGFGKVCGDRQIDALRMPGRVRRSCRERGLSGCLDGRFEAIGRGIGKIREGSDGRRREDEGHAGDGETSEASHRQIPPLCGFRGFTDVNESRASALG